MPLLDHFHPPLSTERHWESFHATWAGAIADALNERWLPEGYFAEEQLHPAARVEIDVATFESGGATSERATSLARKSWSPPAPALTLPGVILEGAEVLVFDREGGPTLVGAVELVSPANKDRPETRRIFAAKCAGLLAAGIGLVLVDVVTSRSANLHNELMELVGHDAETKIAGDLYAAAYQPVRRGDLDQVDLWRAEFSVGDLLPQLPLGIGPDLLVPIDLEGAYMISCRRRRLGS